MKIYLGKDASVWHRCYDNKFRSYYDEHGRCGAPFHRKFCNVRIPNILFINSYQSGWTTRKKIYTHKELGIHYYEELIALVNLIEIELGEI